jgi:hypothetical protein
MKKQQFKLVMTNPCTEDTSKMKANDIGFYCNSCSKNVIDFSNKSNTEIIAIISKLKDKNNFCGSITPQQLEQTYTEFELSNTNNLKYAAALAATLLLSNPTQAQTDIKTNTMQTDSNYQNIHITVGNIKRIEPPASKTITVKGKLLDKTTGKPFTIQQLQTISLSANNIDKNIVINRETGAYSMKVKIFDNDTQLVFIIAAEKDTILYSIEKIIKLDRKKIKKNVLIQNILLDFKTEMYQIILNESGGMGVIYLPTKNKNV